MIKYVRVVLVLFVVTVLLGGACYVASEKIKKNDSEKILFEKVGKILEKRKEGTTGNISLDPSEEEIALEDTFEGIENEDVVEVKATGNDTKEKQVDQTGKTTEQLHTEEPVTTEADVIIDSKGLVESIKIKPVENTPYIYTNENQEIIVKKGTAFYLKTKIKPKEEAAHTKVFWKSDNEEIVSVLEDGKVCAKQSGTATITASVSENGEPKDSVTIKVEQINREDCTLVAHRGKCDDAPENSLAAIELALQEGYVCVEFDVWETLDHEFVVSHDQSLKNSCDKDVNVTDITLEEATNYEIVKGNKLDQYSDEKIPSLDMVLDMAQNYEGRLHIELKETLSKKKLKKLRNMIAQYGLEDQVKIITFSEENIRKMRELDNEGMTPIPLEYLSSEWNKEVYGICKQYQTGIGLSYDQITPKIIEKCHSKGIDVNAWTVNDFNTAYHLVYDLGVDIITSDYFLID